MAPIKDPLIIHLSPFFSPNIGGVETYLDDLTSIISKNQLAQTVVTYSPLTSSITAPFYTHNQKSKITIFRFPHLGGNLFHRLEKKPLLNFFYLTPYLFIVSFFITLFKLRRSIVFHAHGLNSAFVGFLLKFIFRRPLIVNIYSSYDSVPFSPFFLRVIRMVLNQADYILTQSHDSLGSLKSIGIDSHKLDLYHHWIDLSRFKPLSPSQIPRNFLFIGRLIPQKGVRIVLKLAQIFPQLNFLVVGCGPDYQKALKLSKTLKNLKLFGEIPYHDLHHYYQMADVFLFPSLYAEGWGRTAMEAVACSLPVLGSNLGAIPENLDPSVSILFKPTLINFQKQINFIIRSPQTYTKLQKNCRPYALKYYSSKNFSNLKNIYLTTLAV
jgi:glycosyltransferase involved in cell wall biosynthesis